MRAEFSEQTSYTARDSFCQLNQLACAHFQHAKLREKRLEVYYANYWIIWAQVTWVGGGSCHIEFYRVIYELCDQTPARMKLWSASIYASPKWPNKVNCQRSLRNWNHFSKDSKRPAVENKGQSRVTHDYMVLDCMVKNSETILKNPLHLKWNDNL